MFNFLRTVLDEFIREDGGIFFERKLADFNVKLSPKVYSK